MKKILSLFLAFAVAVAFASCSNTAKAKEKYKASFLDLFDTASTVIAYDNSQEEFDRNYQRFYDELKTSLSDRRSLCSRLTSTDQHDP